MKYKWNLPSGKEIFEAPRKEFSAFTKIQQLKPKSMFGFFQETSGYVSAELEKRLLKYPLCKSYFRRDALLFANFAFGGGSVRLTNILTP